MPSPLTRMREHAGWFAALLLTSALVAGLATGIGGYLDRQSATGFREGLAERDGAYRALRLSLPLAPDAAEQDAQVRGMLDRRFGTLATPVAVDRTLQDDVTAVDADGLPHRVTALTLDDVEDRVELVDGTWAGPLETLVQADAAAQLGVEPGDVLELEGTAFTVAGIWRAADRFDPRWLGDPLVETGRSSTAVGPLLVDESAWTSWDDVVPRARWTVVPDLATADIHDLTSLVSAWRTLHRGWEGAEEGLKGLSKSGRLPVTVNELKAELAGFSAVEPVALLVLAAIAVVTFLELARLLTALRATETALLWSRGASALGLAAREAAEAGAVSIVGAALGAGAAVGVLALLTETTVPLPELVVPVLATALVATVAVAVSSARAALRQTVRDPSDAAGRRRRLTGGGALALVLAATALSVWQLNLYGSPVTPTADGGRSVDPVAVPAPALTLVAAALAALALLPLAARLLERRAAHGSVPRLLAARSLSRRPAFAAAPVLVVALGVGGLVTAAGYEATWRTSFDLAAQLRAGADLHVSTDAPGMPPDTLDELQALPGVAGIAPLDLDALQFGSGSGAIVSVAPDALASLAARFPGAFDPAATAEALRIDPVGPAVPPGARELTLAVATEFFDLPPRVEVILRDAYGVLRTVPLEVVGTGSDPRAPDDPTRAETTYAGALPAVLEEVDAEVRVVAFDVRIPPAAVTGASIGVLELRGLSAATDGGEVDLPLEGVWLPDPPVATGAPPTPVEDVVGFRAESATDRARLTASLDGDYSDRIRPPVVVSQALADAYGVGVGDYLTFTVHDVAQQLAVEIAEVVPAVPTSPQAVALLLDLAVVQHYGLRFGDGQTGTADLWIATGDSPATLDAVRALLPANSRVASASDPVARDILGSAAVALWVAAVGCAVLALAGVIAGGGSRRRGRGDTTVLRALGLAPRDQGAIRAHELGTVLAYGALSGLVAGAAVVLLTIAPVARAAVPGADPRLLTHPEIALAPVAIGVGAIVVALAVVVLAASARAARDARRPPSAEGDR